MTADGERVPNSSRLRVEACEVAGGADTVPADASLRALAEDGTALASCALWWRATPLHQGKRTGLIGRYRCADARGGEMLIARACAVLARHGCEFALGPMDGSTWDAYRFVTLRGAAPRFFLEPDNDDDWPRQFARCGFAPVAHYVSALQEDLRVEETRSGRVGARLAREGVLVRSIDPRRLGEELQRLHALVMAGFRSQPYFTPIGERAFAQRFAALLPVLRPEIVLVAERSRLPVALFLALPDLEQARRGERVDTAIVKTVVALPGRAYAGVAHLLAARATAVAREAGFSRAVHALMRAGNASANWSARSGATLRRYALFGRPLQSAGAGGR
ncbi:MAG: N-acetyltransferase [Betaproteobacteria bacterium]|jgi:GNAT superfamily N-acetyltransferase|nr:N-acetyltransferase [Betaproteobacteria bacterium]MDH5286440.1 N-acetyltransferase [Betaproteobacteria bacterium]